MTGKVTQALDSGDESTLERTRWKGESAFQGYVMAFDKPEMHKAIRSLKALCEAATPPLTMQEASLRWIIHHSALQDGDAIIFGAKALDQLESNVIEARRGPLSNEIVNALQDMWETIQSDTEKL